MPRLTSSQLAHVASASDEFNKIVSEYISDMGPEEMLCFIAGISEVVVSVLSSIPKPLRDQAFAGWVSGAEIAFRRECRTRDLEASASVN